MKLLTLLLFFISFSAFASTEVALISVNGVVERSIEPNILQMNVEVWAKAATAKEAQGMQATLFQQVKTTVEKFKIKKEDWQTSYYQVSAEHEYDPKLQRTKQTGFRASQTLNITLRKIDEAGTLIDALIPATEDTKKGVSIQSSHWDSDQKADVEAKAIASAYQAARLRAESLATAARVKIKRPYHISNTSFFAANETSLSAGSSKRAYFAAAADSAPPSTQLTPGQIKVSVTVNADFEIE